MAKTHIRVNGRLFQVKVASLQDSTMYRCMFHEKYEWPFGHAWFYRPANKNSTTVQSDEIHDWFKSMVEDNLPQESGEQILNEVVEQV